jgi:hypothetical protein
MLSSPSLLGAISPSQWQEIASFGLRDEGNLAERQLTAWLMNYAGKAGIEATRHELTSITGGMHSFGSNVDFYFKGQQAQELVFLIPQSHYDPSLIFGIALADILSQQSLQYSMRIIFLTGELSPHTLVASFSQRSSIYPIGSRQIIRQGLINPHSYLFYYQLEDATHHYHIGQGQYLRSPYAPLQVMQDLALSQGWPVQIQSSNVIRRSLDRQFAKPLDEYLDSGYAAITISNSKADIPLSAAQASVWANQLAMATWQHLDNLAYIDLEQEFNYVVMGAFILRERSYLLILMIYIFAMLSFATLKRHNLRSQWRFLLKKGKSILLLLPLLFLALFLSTFIGYGANMRHNQVGLAEYIPIRFVAYKVLWTLFLAALLGRLFEALNLGGRSRFYTIATLVLSSLALVIFSSISVIYALAWAWFLLIVTIYAVVKQWQIRFFAALMAPLLIVVFARDFFRQSSPDFTQLLLFNSVSGNLLLLIVFSPIFMLTMSLMQHRKMLYVQKFPPYLSFVIYLAGIVVLGYSLHVYQPYGSKRAEPIWLLINQGGNSIRTRTSFARIWGVQRLGDITLVNSKTEARLSLVDVPTLLVDEIPITPSPHDFAMRVHYEEVFNRTVSVISLSDLHHVEYLDISVRSERNFGVVDANVPIIVDDQQNLRILLGKNPPPELVIRLISNDPQRLNVQATASYNILDEMHLERANSFLHAAFLHVKKERNRTVVEI